MPHHYGKTKRSASKAKPKSPLKPKAKEKPLKGISKSRSSSAARRNGRR